MSHPDVRRAILPLFLLAALAGCATNAPSPDDAGVAGADASLLPVVNRITFGVNASTYREAQALGTARYVALQLHPGEDKLPPEIDAQIKAMTIMQKPVEQLVMDLEQRRKQVDAITNDDEKKAANQAYQDEYNRLAREAAARSLLRDMYSHNQLKEQMTWFWMNHFSVSQNKSNLRAMVGDYEETAIRPHALGKFSQLLRATVYHPAMLRYLDTEQNAAGHINENYARELMELHTLGVNSGYTQKDVQELARILTGLGYSQNPKAPTVKRELQQQYVRKGLFEFNPNRHDYGDKVFLGQQVKGRGLAEVDEALERLCRNPATARYVSRKLAIYFTGDEPSAQLEQRMADAFQRSDGDIASTLAALFAAPEFRQSLGHAFKDPVHYVVSALRMAYDDKPVLNGNPVASYLYRMGEPLYGRQTPDGYPLAASAWQSSGQMATRFEVAKSIAGRTSGLFKPEGPQAVDHPGFPQLATPLYYAVWQKTLSPTTRAALDQAYSQQDWNAYLLSSPEFMYR